MPFDYLYSMLLALWPKAWFSLMNPKVYNNSTEQGQGGNSREMMKRDAKRLVNTYFVAFNICMTIIVYLNF